MKSPRRRPAHSPPGNSAMFLGEVARRVAKVSQSELPAVLTQILEGVRAVAGLDHGTIFLFEYVFRQAYVLEEGCEPRSLPEHAGLPFFSGRGPDHGATAPAFSGYLAESASPSPALALPVVAGSERLGDFYFFTESGDLALAEERRSLLQSLASLAALALERCRHEKDGLNLDEWRDEVYPLPGWSEPAARAINAEIDEVYVHIRERIAADPGNPGLQDAIAPLRARLRELQKQEAEELEKHFRSHLFFDPRQGRKVFDEARFLLSGR